MAAAMGLGARLNAFVASPTGPRTTHFWGPVANWGFVLAVRAAGGAGEGGRGPRGAARARWA
jgi:hypothetical protein